MLGKEARGRLRGAAYRGDGTGVVHQLRSLPEPAEELQIAGDGLLVALAQQVDGAAELAADYITALRTRDWTGDEQLADALAARLGVGATPLLTPLPVDLEELASSLEGDPVYAGGRIDLRNGEVWPQAAIDYAIETGEEDEDEGGDRERWLQIHCEGSHDAYRDMEWFVADLENSGIADRLRIALDGRGAFRSFRDVLSRWPELVTQWQGFSDDRGRARSWLAGEGYEAVASEPSDP